MSQDTDSLLNRDQWFKPRRVGFFDLGFQVAGNHTLAIKYEMQHAKLIQGIFNNWTRPYGAQIDEICNAAADPYQPLADGRSARESVVCGRGGRSQ